MIILKLILQESGGRVLIENVVEHSDCITDSENSRLPEQLSASKQGLSLKGQSVIKACSSVVFGNLFVI